MLWELTKHIDKMGRPRVHPILAKLNRGDLLKELENNGYVIIPNGVANDIYGSVDARLREYKKWYTSFRECGESIRRNNYVIDSYRISHSEPSWGIRATVRELFGLIWGTRNLFTSVEGIAMFSPPEKGEGEFRTLEACDLHLDQGVRRQGVHAYRGAAYLEESTKDDFCFRVLTKSHKLHSRFFSEFPRAAVRSKKNESIRLGKNEKSWYYQNGCRLINVPVPKGGLLLWDSRMVYDFEHPACGKANTKRWTCISFVSMTPAIWADKDDTDIKSKVFKELLTTSHWSSQGQKIITEDCPKKRKHDGELIKEKNVAVKELPAIALWYPCKRLMGVMDYVYVNNETDGPAPPAWQ